MGYANGNKIIGKVGKGGGIISAWTDEMIHAEEKEILTDKELDKRYNNLRVLMFRSKSLKVSYEKYTDENYNEQYNLDNPIPVKELSWTFQEWDNIVKQHITVTTFFIKHILINLLLYRNHIDFVFLVFTVLESKFFLIFLNKGLKLCKQNNILYILRSLVKKYGKNSVINTVNKIVNDIKIKK